MEKMGPTGQWLKKYIFQFALLGLSCIIVVSCKTDTNTSKATTETKPKKRVKVPVANADSAFHFIEKQLSFGYRVPGTPEHKACKDWLVQKLKSYGAKVQTQEFKASFLGLKDQDSYNIIAQFNTDKKPRVLLGAHWDSRLIAEKDPDESKQKDPIFGANDGGSGVAALIEIARVISENAIDLGVDIILFDAEDNGVSDGSQNNTWCLGAQYWSKNKIPRNYDAKFGILLDMVGAKKSLFLKEEHSRRYAPNITNKVWSLAKRMGYSDLFIDKPCGPIDDDHKYVNEIAKIPMVDIIHFSHDHGGFGPYHHTHDDNISVIDKNVLRRTTQVVLAVIYNESGGNF